MYNWSTNQQHTHSNKGVSVANSIHHSNIIYNYFKTLKPGQFLSDVYLNHLMTIIVSVFLRGYRGKTIDFAQVSHHHRTTIAYFLNHGKWNDLNLQDTLKSSVIQIIYQKSQRSGQPIFLYCGWYDRFTYKTLVTGFASHWSCLFPSVSFKRVPGLWTSGRFRYAFL